MQTLLSRVGFALLAAGAMAFAGEFSSLAADEAGEHPVTHPVADHPTSEGDSAGETKEHAGEHHRETHLHGQVGEVLHHPDGHTQIAVQRLDGDRVEVVVSEVHPEGPITWATDLAVWSFVVFLVFFFVLAKFAWGPLAAGLDQREAKIRKDIDDAESARIAAQKMLAEHQEKLAKVQDEVREILAEARRDAEHTRQEITAAAEREATASKERAVAEIQRVRDQALDELFAHFSSTVANATEHVLGRSMSGADDERLVNEAVAAFARQRA